MIFDEPTSGLDYARMVEVSGVIRDLARRGLIVLVLIIEWISAKIRVKLARG